MVRHVDDLKDALLAHQTRGGRREGKSGRRGKRRREKKRLEGHLNIIR